MSPYHLLIKEFADLKGLETECGEIETGNGSHRSASSGESAASIPQEFGIAATGFPDI